MKSANNKLTIIADVLLLLLFAAVLSFIIWRFGDLFGLTGDKNKFYIWLAGIMSFIFLRASWYFSRLYRVRRERRQSEEQGEYPEKEIRYEPGQRTSLYSELFFHLRDRYGLFWQRQVRLLLVTGEPEQVEAIAPGLTEQRWQEGDHTVLIYGGKASAEPDTTLLASLKKLRRFRPLDGIIWPLTEKQSCQTAQLDKGWRELGNGGKLLGFQAPLYLWQVCDDGGYQAGRTLQSVGCLLPE